MESLLAEYRAYGLPFPPRDAPLVAIESRGILNGHLQVERMLLFLVRPETEVDTALCLAGTDWFRPYRGTTFITLPPTAESGQGRRPMGGESFFGMLEDHWEPNVDLVMALQCEERGWHDLARVLFARSLRPRWGATGKPLDPHRELAWHAWNHWCLELGEAGSDRRAIAGRMAALLRTPHGLDTDERRELLRSLRATLVPSTAAPDSVEALVDGLVEYGGKPDGFHGEQKAVPDVNDFDPRYWNLLLRGFEAVPTLVRHLDDERLTRKIHPAVMNASARHVRVADVAAELLIEFADQGASRPGRSGWELWHRTWFNPGPQLDREVVGRWWAKASAMGEEAYLLKHVIPKDGPGEYGPNAQMLHLIAARYPRHLPGLYETMIRKWPHAPNHLLAELVGKSGLSVEAKARLFLLAARSGDLQQRLIGLQQLFDMKHPQAAPLLIEAFRLLPRTPKGEYWLSQAKSVGRVACRTDDPRVWEALAATARRVDVGHRMEIIDVMSYGVVEKLQRPQRIAFLRNFLDDRSVRDVRDNPAAYEGPCAGFTFDRLAVRDLAAQTLATILGVPFDPDPAWTEPDWAALRQRVQAALPRE